MNNVGQDFSVPGPCDFVSNRIPSILLFGDKHRLHIEMQALMGTISLKLPTTFSVLPP